MLPMSGVRVLEVAQFTFTPSAGAVLADWGADVIKVEHAVAGDAQRGLQIGTGGVAQGSFQPLMEHPNRGKRSIGLALEHPAARGALFDLARRSDVFLTNFLPGARTRLGIDVDDLRAVNPQIIYVRGSAHGQRGPDAAKGGYDGSAFWSRAGSAMGSTPPDSPQATKMPAGAYGDSLGGMTIAGGIAAALFARDRTGLPSVVDVSLLSVGIWATALSVNNALLTGSVPAVQPLSGASSSPFNPTIGNFRTSDDRWINLTMLQPGRYWADLCRHLGLEDLITDQRFDSAEKLFARASDAGELIAKAIAAKPYGYWLGRLQTLEGQWAPNNNALEVGYASSSRSTARRPDTGTADPIPGWHGGRHADRPGRHCPGNKVLHEKQVAFYSYDYQVGPSVLYAWPLVQRSGGTRMLPDDTKIISVDDHVIEHPRVWLDRLPSKYAEAAPRIEKLPDGNDTWLYEGSRSGNFALNAVAGKHPREFGMDPRSYEDMLPGCYSIEDRIKDMDIEGVWAQLCFPNFGGFAGSTFFAAKDKDLAKLCISAYNDFILDEWCAYAPDRQIPLMMVPYWDVEASVREIERTVAKGAKSISFLEAPHKLGLPSYHTDHWDPILRVCEEAGLPLSMHFGSGGMPQGLAPDGDFFIGIALFGLNSMMATVDLLISDVFYKFPNLKVALSEGGIGWMPYLLERVDYSWGRHKYWCDINKDKLPSELFREHIYGCFIADQSGIEARHRIGVDNILFESDYPHSDSNWPHTRKLLAEHLAQVPDDEARKIVELNARALYHFPA